MWASLNNNVEIAIALLDKKAEIEAKNNDGLTALQLASLSGHDAMVKFLLQQGSQVNSKSGKKNRSALMLAAEKGRHDVTKSLINHGAEVNAQDAEGYTALMLGSVEGHLPVVKFLLESGADSNLSNRDKVTALMEASFKGYIDVARELIKGGALVDTKSGIAGVTALWFASAAGHPDLADYLWQQGADVNIRSKKSDSALIIGSENGNLEVVRLLLEKGADPNVKNQSGQTAPDIAKKCGYFHVAWLIHAYGRTGTRVVEQAGSSHGGDGSGRGRLGINMQNLNDNLARIYVRWKSPARNDNRKRWMLEKNQSGKRFSVSAMKRKTAAKGLPTG